MKFAAFISSRLLDCADIVFEAGEAIWRVLMRGAFTPDAASYRGPRHASLGSSDVLVQEIAVNAGDRTEALRAVTLDPENTLPLAADAVVFDIAGPTLDHGAPRSRPERAFVLGVVRKDALDRARIALASGARTRVEAFVHTPSAHPSLVLVFGDETGRKRRRFRRSLTAAALIAVSFFAAETLTAAHSALEARVTAAENERMQVDRRIRLNERRLRETQAAASTPQAPLLSVLAEQLSRLSLHLAADAEISRIEVSPPDLKVEGRSYTPDATELQWRRAFEGERLLFTAAASGDPPATFEGRLSIGEMSRTERIP